MAKVALSHLSALTAGHFLANAPKSNQKRLRSTIRPYAALRVPSLRCLPGPRGLRFAAQIYISRLRLRRRVLAHLAHLALQAPLLSLLKSRICVAWTCAHEDQEQRIAALSQKPKPSPRFEFFFCVACSGLFAGKPAPTGSPPAARTARYLWERACPRRGRYIKHICHYRKITPAQSPPLTSRLQEAERRCL